MEEAFIKSFKNRKVFEIKIPTTRYNSNSIVRVLRKDDFNCYMVVSVWGRTYVRRVHLVRAYGGVYSIETYKYMPSLIPQDTAQILTSLIYKDREDYDKIQYLQPAVEVSARWKSITLLDNPWTSDAVKVDFYPETDELDIWYSEHGNKLIENLKDNYIFPMNYGGMEKDWIKEHFPHDAARINSFNKNILNR